MMGEEVAWSAWMESKIEDFSDPKMRNYIRILVEAAYQTGRADNATEMERKAIELFGEKDSGVGK